MQQQQLPGQDLEAHDNNASADRRRVALKCPTTDCERGHYGFPRVPRRKTIAEALRMAGV